jgi:hypothetical protein
MRRQGLQGRRPKRHRGLTSRIGLRRCSPTCCVAISPRPRPTRSGVGTSPRFPPMRASCIWRRCWICPSDDCCPGRCQSTPMAELTSAAIKMAAAVRGSRGVIDQVIFHTDRGSTYTAKDFTTHCRRLGIRQSMGRVASCFDNAASVGILLHAGTRSPVPASVCYRGPGPRRRDRLVPTTYGADTVRPACCHPSSTKGSGPSNRRPHRGSLHDSGEAHSGPFHPHRQHRQPCPPPVRLEESVEVSDFAGARRLRRT